MQVLLEGIHWFLRRYLPVIGILNDIWQCVVILQKKSVRVT